MYINGMSLDKLMFLGRWGAMATLKHYVQEAVASLTLARLEPKALYTLNELTRMYPEAPEPPAEVWTSFFSRHTQARRSFAARLARSRRLKYSHGL